MLERITTEDFIKTFGIKPLYLDEVNNYGDKVISDEMLAKIATPIDNALLAISQKEWTSTIDDAVLSTPRVITEELAAATGEVGSKMFFVLNETLNGIFSVEENAFLIMLLLSEDNIDNAIKLLADTIQVTASNNNIVIAFNELAAAWYQYPNVNNAEFQACVEAEFVEPVKTWIPDSLQLLGKDPYDAGIYLTTHKLYNSKAYWLSKMATSEPLGYYVIDITNGLDLDKSGMPKTDSERSLAHMMLSFYEKAFSPEYPLAYMSTFDEDRIAIILIDPLKEMDFAIALDTLEEGYDIDSDEMIIKKMNDFALWKTYNPMTFSANNIHEQFCDYIPAFIKATRDSGAKVPPFMHGINRRLPKIRARVSSMGISPDKSKDTLMAEAMAFCESCDKSTEYMIQYMQDFAQVDHDTVVDFLVTKGGFTDGNDD